VPTLIPEEPKFLSPIPSLNTRIWSKTPGELSARTTFLKGLFARSTYRPAWYRRTMSKTRTTCALLLSAALASGAVAQEAPPGALPSELPLHTAIAAGDLDAVRHLLELGADPNALISTAGADIKTPLSVAFRDWPWAKDGFGEAVRLLLEAGADPNTGWCSQNRAYTALGWAEGTERTESLALLRAAGAHRTSLDLAMARNATEAALHAAVFEQDIPRVKRLLQAGSDPNAVVVGLEFANGDVDRLRPLRLALAVPEESVPFEEFWANRIEGVRLLLAAGADPNEPFASMCVPGRPTPLLKAIRGYEEEVAMLLLKAGADPNAERRVLAQMEHPGIARLVGAGIARLVGAGVAGDGTPYFVMEYKIRGTADACNDAQHSPVTTGGAAPAPTLSAPLAVRALPSFRPRARIAFQRQRVVNAVESLDRADLTERPRSVGTHHRLQVAQCGREHRHRLFRPPVPQRHRHVPLQSRISRPPYPRPPRPLIPFLVRHAHEQNQRRQGCPRKLPLFPLLWLFP
jgi:hypothetical protein